MVSGAAAVLFFWLGKHLSKAPIAEDLQAMEDLAAPWPFNDTETSKAADPAPVRVATVRLVHQSDEAVRSSLGQTDDAHSYDEEGADARRWGTR